MVLTEDGVVYTKGTNDCGQLGRGRCSADDCFHFGDSSSVRGKPIVIVGAGFDFTVLLSERGMVLTCGNAQFGCLGHGDAYSLDIPKLIEG